MSRTLRVLSSLTVAVALALLSTDVAACPNCKEAVAVQPEAADAGLSEVSPRTSDGYNYSILFMMGMPFVLLSTGVLMLVRAAKKGAIPEL